MKCMSTVFILYRSIRHTKFMPYTLPCTLNVFLFQMNTMEPPQRLLKSLTPAIVRFTKLWMPTKKHPANSFRTTAQRLFQPKLHWMHALPALISANWPHALLVTRILSIFYVAGWLKRTLLLSGKISRMMKRSSVLWKTRKHLPHRNRLQSCETLSFSSLLKCMSRCMVCRHTTKWTQPGLWLSHIPSSSAQCSET